MSTKTFFSLQWHITTLCDQRCKICYLYNSLDGKNEIRNSKKINIEVLKVIADNFIASCKRIDAVPRIFMTGGDPILSPYFWELLTYLHSNNVRVSIMGNPFHITNDTAKKMRLLGVLDYQMSLDGLEQMHDSFRKKGSFQTTFRAAKILKNNDIEVGIMTTVSKENANDIVPLTRLIVDAGIASSTFARYCPNSKEELDVMFLPLEYKTFLENMWEVYDELYDRGTKFPLKDHLWKLLLMEKGLFNPIPTDNIVVSGCGMGVSHMTVLADGTVYACRRFKSPIGKVPEQNFDDLFFSKDMEQYRIPENYHKCCECELYTYCRGCSAVSHNVTGSWKSIDPQCWKY